MLPPGSYVRTCRNLVPTEQLLAGNNLSMCGFSERHHRPKTDWDPLQLAAHTQDGGESFSRPLKTCLVFAAHSSMPVHRFSCWRDAHALPSANAMIKMHLQLWGLLIGAPSAHFWHYYLQKWFARKTDTFETAIQKVSPAVIATSSRHIAIHIAVMISCSVDMQPSK